ncbi:alcohol dehydrogenase catalytic domain-containing protein [Solirubrobacter sp. CPCC 204708]|uniref:Alcohol dehydrogenase catalytic domain-containing protein n=1 Tax=Solirubrobacter deserti TaxID=2282478 RepID=A0ABT4RQ67_9ACTN|nr:alcohol dehydrogenase catalytic domain-containing protein [Solirubrobacter deserti]MBE2320471.1 alcohol dehydrogenase catalytic domain-containing protein [Solirubrobacter deserti]MDA0140718.1 alcohol dehydrogenase catalytic domain-containing protein [Solirubrobacter deserti]
MRAIVWHGPNEMAVEEQPTPTDPGPGELILQPEAVGICGSEVEGYVGHMKNRVPPLVMGHEFAGTVIATGDGAQDLQGARVAVNPLSGCGECRLCLAGDTNLCADRVLVGVHVPGAFADFVKVRAADALRLPDDVSMRVGALMEPLANGVHAVRLAPSGASRVVVIGAGTIGLVTLQAALLEGLPHVAVVERDEARRARAVSLGAHADGAEPGEADLVLDAVGAEATRQLGLELLRPGGTIVCIGLASDDTTLGFHGVVRSQHRIQGSYAYTMPDFEQAHEWLVSGAASLGDDLEPVRPLEDGPAQFARLAQGPPPPEFKIFLAGTAA